MKLQILGEQSKKYNQIIKKRKLMKIMIIKITKNYKKKMKFKIKNK